MAFLIFSTCINKTDMYNKKEHSWEKKNHLKENDNDDLRKNK